MVRARDLGQPKGTAHPIQSEIDLALAVEAGLKPVSAEALSDTLGLSAEEFERLVMPRRTLGDAWFSAGETPLLRVPPAPLRESDEYGYVINPQHPHVAQITIASAEPFAIDLRLICD